MCCNERLQFKHILTIYPWGYTALLTESTFLENPGIKPVLSATDQGFFLFLSGAEIASIS